MKSLATCFFAMCLLLALRPSLFGASDHYSFDLGTATSPVKTRWTQITHESVYTPERSYGWTRPTANTFNDAEPVAPQFRATHPNYVGPLDDPILRDGVEDAQPLTFLIDVPFQRGLAIRHLELKRKDERR